MENDLLELLMRRIQEQQLSDQMTQMFLPVQPQVRAQPAPYPPGMPIIEREEY